MKQNIIYSIKCKISNYKALLSYQDPKTSFLPINEASNCTKQGIINCVFHVNPTD